MKYKKDTYYFRKEETEKTDGVDRYFVSFKDGQGIFHETEVSYLVYTQLSQNTIAEESLKRSDRRHIERSDLMDETLNDRALFPPKGTENEVFGNLRDECLWQAIQQLPKIQRRRFVFYYVYELTYEQIAKIEGCSFRAIKYSTDIAKEKIKKFFED